MTSNTETIIKKESAAALGFRWLLESGIQDMSHHSDYRGGVNAWFDLQSGSYPFIYSEITGYAVCATLYAHQQTNDDAYLEAARKAADWLIRNQCEGSEFIRTRRNHPLFQTSYFSEYAFTFDQWVIVYGLANLAKVTGEFVYRGSAEALAQYLMKYTLRSDGSFEPIYNVTKSKSFWPGHIKEVREDR